METGTQSPYQSVSSQNEAKLLTGEALKTKLSYLRYQHLEVLAARCALGTAAMGALTLLAYTVWRSNLILSTYDQETMYQRSYINWLIAHGTLDRSKSSPLTS
jgi:hypothetical protein